MTINLCILGLVLISTASNLKANANETAGPLLIGVNLGDNELKQTRNDLLLTGNIEVKSLRFNYSGSVVKEVEQMCKLADSLKNTVGLFEKDTTTCYEHQLLASFSIQSGLPIFSALSDDHFENQGCGPNSQTAKKQLKRIGFGASSYLKKEAMHAFLTIKRRMAMVYDSDKDLLKYASFIQNFPPEQMSLIKWSDATNRQFQTYYESGVNTFLFDLSKKNALNALAQIVALKSGMSTKPDLRIYILNQNLPVDEIQAFDSSDLELHTINLEPAFSLNQTSPISDLSVSVRLIATHLKPFLNQKIKFPLCQNGESNSAISETILQAVKRSLRENIGYYVVPSEKKREILSLAYSDQLVESHSIKKVSKFNLYQGLRDSKLPNRLGRETGKKILKVTTIYAEPFVMFRDAFPNGTVATGNDRFFGLCVDILAKIAQKLNYGYEIEMVADGRYGAFVKNKWNGMIGEIVRKEKDMAIGPISITSKREEVVSFSSPFMDAYLSVLMKKPGIVKRNLMEFLFVYKGEVWALVLFFYVLISVVIYLFGRISPYEWDRLGQTDASNSYILSNCFWLVTIGTQSLRTPPRASSTRFLYTLWRMVLFFILAIYAAQVSYKLTYENLAAPIKKIEDLPVQTKAAYGVLKGGSTAALFKASVEYPYNQIWNYMSANPDAFSLTTKMAIDRVSNENYVFIMETPFADYHLRQNCDLMRSEKSSLGTSYSLVFQKNSKAFEEFNGTLNEMILKNEIKAITEKWLDETSRCDPKFTPIDGSMGLDYTGGLFFLLLLGIIIGLLLCLGEIFCWIYQKHGGNLGAYPGEISGHLRKVFTCRTVEVNNAEEKYTIVKPAPDENMEEINLQSTEKGEGEKA